MQKFRSALESLDPWKLSAFDTAARNLKSLSLGLSLVEGEIDCTQAVKFATLESQHQIEKWGIIPDAHEVDGAKMEKIIAAAAIVASA